MESETKPNKTHHENGQKESLDPQKIAPTTLHSNIPLEDKESSSAGEFHPHALPEPDVNLSIHPALIVQPLAASPFANGQIDWVPSLQCARTNRPPSVREA